MAKTNKGRKFFATTATAALVASAIVPVASAAQVNDFNSIASYAQEAVQDLVDRGVVQGDASGNFQPRKSVSRAEAATILTGALGLTTSDDVYFTDVKSGAWYYDAINAAVNNGVFAGKGAGIFEPNGNLTRGEAAIILVNAFDLDGRASLAQFSDEKSVKAWAVESLEIAVGNGVIKGDNGKIKANDAITKQDFAVMFSRAEAAAEAVSAHSVKVINATTVEVTFPEAVSDAAKLNIAIDGLTISNKAVKQSNNKTVVLTTSAQEAGKEYTVTVDGDAVGKFTGVAQVIPTSVTISEQSLQAKVGSEVTLKAQVTVAEGQSKANIPVTFNIVNSSVTKDVNGKTVSISTSTLNQPIVVEALTDENGVATYTYTRYAQTSYQIASHDEVQAYATGNPTLRSFSKVYWANIQPLTVAEVTQGNSLTNGAKKVYKVKIALEHAEPVLDTAGNHLKDAAGNLRYKVNVGFNENVGVTPDKAIKTIDVIDGNGVNLGYPGQYTTSTADGNALNAWVKEVEIEVDRNGEAIFTLSGNANTVTPFVFVDQIVNPTNAAGSQGRFETTELNFFLPALTFGKQHTLGLTNAAKGVQYAAGFLEDNTGKASHVGSPVAPTDADHPLFNNEDIANYLDNGVIDVINPKLTAISSTVVSTLPGYKFANVAEKEELLRNTGGRDYTATLTDDKGTVAPAGTPVQLSVAYGSSLKVLGGSLYVVDNNTNTIYELTKDTSKAASEVVTLKADSKGAVSYTLIGHKDTYATPTVFIESGDVGSHVNNTGSTSSTHTVKPSLDKNDLQTAGEIVYFSDALIKDATLTKEAYVHEGRTGVLFTYQSVDQNGKVYRPEVDKVSRFITTFQISTTFNAVKVSPVTEYGFVVDKQLYPYATEAETITDPVYEVLQYLNTNQGEFAHVTTLDRKVVKEYVFEKATRVVGQDSTGNYGTVYETFTMLTNLDGVAQIFVEMNDQNIGTTVNITASASDASLPQLKTISHTFGNTAVTAPYTGVIAGVANGQVSFDGKLPLNFNADTAKYLLIGGTTLTKEEFNQIAGQKNVSVLVQYKLENNVPVFTILSVNGQQVTQVPGAVALAAAQTAAAALKAADYTTASYAAVTNALAAATALPATATDAQKQVAADAITAAINALQPTGTTPVFTTTTNVTTANDVATLGLVGTTATSSVETVATVTISEGKIAVTSVKEGTATVTVKNDAGHAATIAVTVNAKGEITLSAPVKYEEQGETTVTLKDLGIIKTDNIFNGTSIITVKASTLPENLVGKTLSVTFEGQELTFVPNVRNSDNLNITVPTASFNQASFEALVVTVK